MGRRVCRQNETLHAHRTPSRWRIQATRTAGRIQAWTMDVLAWAQAVRQDHVGVTRVAAHLAVLALIGVALLSQKVHLPSPGRIVNASSVQDWQAGHLLLASFTQGRGPSDEGYLVRAVIPHTVLADTNPGLGGLIHDLEDETLFQSRDLRVIPHFTRTDIMTYTVRTGDTVYGIAERFGISPNTIMWSNDKLEDNPDLLSIGQQLVILPVSGVYHTVAKGDTLEKLAEKYKVDVSAITGFELNRVSTDEGLWVGQKLVIPGGRKPYIPRVVTATYTAPIPSDAAKGTGAFGWPVSGRLTQKYWQQHRGLDIGAPKGSPVYAADAGFVVYAGWSDVGYGYMVLIDHGNGFRTLYAHLGWFYVEKGHSVAKGEKLGLVGSTGRATGPHLHFEITLNGVKRNPLGFLP